MILIPAAKAGQKLVEVLDSAGRPLCVMAKNEVLSQGLCHRACALLPRLPGDDWLLGLGDGGWTFPALDMPCAGQAAADCAQELLALGWQAEAPVREMARLRREGLFLHVYSCRLPADALARLPPDPRSSLQLSQAELDALMRSDPGLFEPLLAWAMRELSGN